MTPPTTRPSDKIRGDQMTPPAAHPKHQGPLIHRQHRPATIPRAVTEGDKTKSPVDHPTLRQTLRISPLHTAMIGDPMSPPAHHLNHGDPVAPRSLHTNLPHPISQGIKRTLVPHRRGRCPIAPRPCLQLTVSRPITQGTQHAPAPLLSRHILLPLLIPRHTRPHTAGHQIRPPATHPNRRWPLPLRPSPHLPILLIMPQICRTTPLTLHHNHRCPHSQRPKRETCTPVLNHRGHPRTSQHAPQVTHLRIMTSGGQLTLTLLLSHLFPLTPLHYRIQTTQNPNPNNGRPLQPRHQLPLTPHLTA
jgi:hypothetical protein